MPYAFHILCWEQGWSVGGYTLIFWGFVETLTLHENHRHPKLNLGSQEVVYLCTWKHVLDSPLWWLPSQLCPCCQLISTNQPSSLYLYCPGKMGMIEILISYILEMIFQTSLRDHESTYNKVIRCQHQKIQNLVQFGHGLYQYCTGLSNFFFHIYFRSLDKA